MRHLSWFLGLTAALMVAVGCSSGPRMYKVTGTVTLDGKPLPEGEILFVPDDPKYGPDPGKIKDGRFEFKAKAGKKRVEISASRILPGGARGAGGEPVPEEYLPDRYNVHSILTAEVTPNGPNHFAFELKGGKR
jgi:hypothetical protein